MSSQKKQDKVQDLPAKKLDVDAVSQPQGGVADEAAQIKGGATSKRPVKP
jgi:hypothetical protein